MPGGASTDSSGGLGLPAARGWQRVSIVCVTHARRDHVLRSLDSCVRQEYANLEILVVVNPSGDGTEQAIAQRFPGVRLLQTPRNIGFFPALNLGIANASGDYVMTVDDDACFLSADAIKALVAEFGREPALGAVTCNLEGPGETPMSGGDRYIEVFSTGFTMLPRRVFTEWVGYYPDLFFRSGGETYLCTALWDQGRRVKRLERVRMYHARTMDGRSLRDWKFHALRSQILCTLMREPWYLVPPSLLSKALKSLGQYAHSGQLTVWLSAWLSAALNAPASLRLRKPISWRTQRLLWRLRTEAVTHLNMDGVGPQADQAAPARS